MIAWMDRGPVRQTIDIATLVVLLGILATIWPARFGGAATFVVVRGESMEPTYHTGDLIYARSADSFGIGDVAVYRSSGEADDGQLVIHRIIDRDDDGRFVFLGDNREYPDDVRPMPQDLVARPVVNLGPWPTQVLLRLPLLLAFVVGVTVVWWLWPRAAEFDDTELGDTEFGDLLTEV